jgi:long-subunit fatty acid transport protein
MLDMLKSLPNILTLTICSLGFIAQGQIASEVETFLPTQLHGTARYTAMGGAFTSLGNDATAMGINPASLSVYRFNEASLSLGFQTHAAQLGPFYGREANSNDLFANVENFGLSFQIGENTKSQSKFSFGVYHNLLADYSHQYRIQGDLNNNTLGEFWGRSSANQNVDLISDDAFAAWQAYVLVSEKSGNNDFIQNPDNSFAYGELNTSDSSITATSNPTFNYNQQGALSQTGFVLAGQQTQKFQYGLGISFPTLNLRREEFITERINEQSSAPYNLTEYTYRRLSDINANGFNFNLGFIYRPIPEFRIGASYQSPSWYTVNQIYDVDVSARFNAPPFSGVSTNPVSEIITSGEYSYRLRTPAIYRLGLSTVLAQKFILSLDYQLTSAQNTSLYTNNRSFNVSDGVIAGYENELNRLLNNQQSSFALGLEYKLKNLFLRGGYRLNQSPYGEDVHDFTTSDISIISGGIGYQFKTLMVNVTYAQSSYNQNLITYTAFNGNTNQVEQVLEDVATQVSQQNILVGITYKW